MRVYDLVVNIWERAAPGSLAGFPRLSAFCQRIGDRPRIKAWHASEQCAAIDKWEPLHDDEADP